MTQDLFDNKYKIERVLGKGGMGTVYLARNVKLGTLWAIKQVNKNVGENVDLLAEPNMLKKLNHPSLPRIFDIIEDEESIYIIEDYIEGDSLDKVIKDAGRFPEKTVVDWAKQLCEVLIYLHTQKPNPIIYRDMKPANIIVNSEGKVKLIDFGISREYKKGSDSDTTYIGTRGYAAPEQYGTSQTDARTDIYSLGVTLYHLITGKSPNEPPYEIKPVRQLDKKLSRGIEYIINKCTALDPQRRYQSVKQLLNDLNNIKKFDSEYKKKILIADLKVALIICLLISFSYLTYAGHLQLEKEKVDLYEKTVFAGKELTEQRKYDEAINKFIEANSQITERIDGYREIALIYLKQLKYDECIRYVTDEVFRSVDTSTTDAGINYILGTAYFEKEDYEKAAYYFNIAKDSAPSNVDYQRDLGVSFARQGQLEKAESVLNEIKNKGMAEEASYFVSGEINLAKKDVNAAVEDFTQCINVVKDEELKKKVYISLARVYRNFSTEIEGSIDKQIEILEKSNTDLKEKNNITITEILGEAYFKKAAEIEGENDKNEYFKKAVKSFELLLTMGYNRPYIFRNIGIIYQEMEDFKKAESILLQMVEMYPENYRGYLQLAWLHLQKEGLNKNEHRDYGKVVEYYKKVLKVTNNNQDNLEDITAFSRSIDELREKKWID